MKPELSLWSQRAYEAHLEAILKTDIIDHKIDKFGKLSLQKV